MTGLESSNAQVEQVIADPLRFKIKLDIGDEVYSSLKLKKYLLDAVDAGNGALTGSAVASSAAVATTFFAPTGFWAALGFGTAVTPIGWVIAAGAAGAGLSVAFGRLFVRSSSGRVAVIPDFINTPLDLLATDLFNFIAGLGIKVANADGQQSSEEIDLIKKYFVNEWGYDVSFVAYALNQIQSEERNYSLKGIAQSLAEYKLKNPDCNYKSMCSEVISFLHSVSSADGLIDEREEMAIEKVKQIFDEADRFSIQKSTEAGVQRLKSVGAKALDLRAEMSSSLKRKFGRQ